jgi:hypothetical protein
MSQAAIMKAVRDKLRTSFSFTEASCEVGFDGSPKPACGEHYIAVHPGRWAGISGDWDLGEEFEVLVTHTLRMGFAGKDRWGIAVWLAEGGMEEIIRQTVVAIHHDQAVRIAADAFITGGASGKMLTPLILVGVQPPTPRGPDWFSAAPAEGDYQVAECGVSQTITFGKCQRVQSIPDMD